MGAICGAVAASLASSTVYGVDIANIFPARATGRTAGEQGA